MVSPFSKAIGEKRQTWNVLLGLSLMTGLLQAMVADSYNKGPDIRAGGSFLSCIHYTTETETFFMNCSVDWTNSADYIELSKNEVFDGQDFVVRLGTITNWQGMFKVAGSSSLDNGPVIKNLHFQGGATKAASPSGGGFVMQPWQYHFTIQSCSSNGTIECEGGGICGKECSGEMLIINCSSTGVIKGSGAGGIVGMQFGRNDPGHGNITRCFSTGSIHEDGAGGIAGKEFGTRGEAYIIESYSTGDIIGSTSGGLVGEEAGKRDILKQKHLTPHFVRR